MRGPVWMIVIFRLCAFRNHPTPYLGDPRSHAESLSLLVCVEGPEYPACRGRAFRAQPSRPESDGVQIAVLDHEPQPHRRAGQLAQVRIALPGNHAFDLVAVDLSAVGQCEALDRLSELTLQFHAHTARGRERVPAGWPGCLARVGWPRSCQAPCPGCVQGFRTCHSPEPYTFRPVASTTTCRGLTPGPTDNDGTTEPCRLLSVL